MKAHPSTQVPSSYHNFGFIRIRVYKRTTSRGVARTRSSAVQAMIVVSMLGGSTRFEDCPDGGGMAEVMSRSECVWMCESRPACDDMLTPMVMLCVDFLSMLIHRHERGDPLNRTTKSRRDRCRTAYCHFRSEVAQN